MSSELHDMDYYEQVEQSRKQRLQPYYEENPSNDIFFPTSGQHQELDGQSFAIQSEDKSEIWLSVDEQTKAHEENYPESFMELDEQRNGEVISQKSNIQSQSQLPSSTNLVASSDDDSQLQESSKQSEKIPKRKKINKDKLSKKNDYPTKNFLPKFKQGILSYLRQHLLEQFDSYKFLKQIQTKKGISMKDYQEIFTQQAFKNILERMFKQKHFYRVLMVSRVSSQSRKILMKKIPVFEYAFIRGKFTNIN